MRKWCILFLSVLLFILFSGCGREKYRLKKDEYEIYYINLEETALIKDFYEAENHGVDELILELLNKMQEEPKEKEQVALLNEVVQVLDYQYDGSNLSLNLSFEYQLLPKTKEVLVRAGLVRTMNQIKGIDTVSILIQGEPLCDSKGMQIGPLTAQSFIENSGKQINTYKSDMIRLYFTNETGNVLVAETRKLYYSSNVSLEQVVVEQLIKGPGTEGNYATLPGNVKIMSVTVVDRTCYVNFDDTFSNNALSIQEEIPIYSIVNSIIENCNVKQVQISMNGESDLIFRETMKLSEFYTMNTDLILEVDP